MRERGIYHPRVEYPAPTKAEMAKTAVGASVGFLKPPSEPGSPA